MEQFSEGQKPKKKFQVKIAGFTFGVVHFAILGIIILVIIISSAVKSSKEQKEAEEAAKKAEEMAQAAANSAGASDGNFDLHDEMQKSLTAQYGEAPEGFEWDYSGQLVPLGNDDNATCEDVIYMFIRSLSILDFSTAEKYSTNSAVVTAYKNYYGTTSNVINDYYSNFLRKQFKKSITSIEINNISDTAVFSDGSQYVTLSLNVLDLTDKDFWQGDKDNLYATMRTYKETETDDTKMNQYVYDYIYSKYEDGTIGKRPVTIELVVTKQNGGGWLVSGDGELDAALQYESGVDVATYIISNFNTWYRDKLLDEQTSKVNDISNSIQNTVDSTEN